MDEPHHPDQDGRCAPHHQMRQEDPFQFLTLEFPLPGQYSGDNHGYGCNRRDEQVVVGSRSQQALPLPLRKEIKELLLCRTDASLLLAHCTMTLAVIFG